MNILLTGGVGYIGSHTAVVLINAGYDVVLLDNFSNCQKFFIDQIYKITGKSFFYVDGDVRDTRLIEHTLKKYKINAVIHFAGLKSVGDSSLIPIDYFSNNLSGTISLLEAMKLCSVKTLIFSSSATVYGLPHYLPLDENHPVSAINPYGRTKLYIEEILKDVVNANIDWNIICLRYFNPVGAHSSGLIGESPNGVPNNLMPYIAQVACGNFPHLNVFGNDYPSVDGTAVRDYIHVMDLAEGHLAALLYAINNHPGWDVFNLGTGTGTTVLELVLTYERNSNKKIPYVIRGRRSGDIPICYSSAEKANTMLNWKATRPLDKMCEDSWLWQSNYEVKKKT